MGNNMRYFWMVMLTAFTLSSLESLAKGPATPRTIAIMPMGYQGGFSEDKARILDELIKTEIANYPELHFITAKDIEGILGFEAMKQAFDCNLESCAAEIGGALGVSEVVTGTASKLGSKVIITLTRIDTSKVAVLGRGSSTTHVSKDDDLIAGVHSSFKAMMKRQVSVVKKTVPSVVAKPKAHVASEALSKSLIPKRTHSGDDGRNWEPGAITWTFWTAGIVAAASGFVMFSRAQSQEAESFETNVPGSQNAAYNASKNALLANVLFGGAGGLVGVGVMTWLLFDLTPEGSEVAVDAGPSGMSLRFKKAW
jgi:hypothetical protein